MKVTEKPASEEDNYIANLAVTDIAFGPRYIDSDGTAIFESSTHTISKLLASENIKTSRVVPNNKEAEINENAYEFLLPVIILSGAFVSQNPHLISLSLNIISSYIDEYFIGIRNEKIVKCKILIKGKKKIKKIFYEGPPEEFSELKNILESVDD